MPDDNYAIERFNSKVAQDYYIKKARAGLWKPEELLIKQYFGQKSRVLDLGCGTGRTTIPLFNLGYDVVGVDAAQNMIKNAKKINKRITYELQDARKLNFQDNSFDNVLFSNNGWAQIPGKENRTKALEEIHRVMKKNGYYIFSVQSRWHMLFSPSLLFTNPFGDAYFSSEGAGALKYDKKQYVYLPSQNELKKELKQIGFKVELCKTFVLFRKLDLFFPVFYVCRKI